MATKLFLSTVANFFRDSCPDRSWEVPKIQDFSRFWTFIGGHAHISAPFWHPPPTFYFFFCFFKMHFPDHRCCDSCGNVSNPMILYPVTYGFRREERNSHPASQNTVLGQPALMEVGICSPLPNLSTPCKCRELQWGGTPRPTGHNSEVRIPIPHTQWNPLFLTFLISWERSKAMVIGNNCAFLDPRENTPCELHPRNEERGYQGNMTSSRISW